MSAGCKNDDSIYSAKLWCLVDFMRLQSAMRLALHLPISDLFPSFRWFQQKYSVFTMIHTRASLSLNWRWTISSAVAFGTLLFTLSWSQTPPWEVMAQWKKQWMRVAAELPSQLNLQLPSVALTRNSVGNKSWTSFHEKEISLLERAFRWMLFQMLFQGNVGRNLSTLHGL